MNFKKQKITAFFLLGVFLLTLLSSVLPHTHHSHMADFSLAFSSEQTHEHSYYGEYHHHYSELDAICEFHECHTHECHFHELSNFTVNKTQKIQKSAFSELFLSNIFSFNKTLTLSPKNNIVYKEKPYENLYLLSTSLRGPPFLA